MGEALLQLPAPWKIRGFLETCFQSILYYRYLEPSEEKKCLFLKLFRLLYMDHHILQLNFISAF